MSKSHVVKGLVVFLGLSALTTAVPVMAGEPQVQSAVVPDAGNAAKQQRLKSELVHL